MPEDNDEKLLEEHEAYVKRNQAIRRSILYWMLDFWLIIYLLITWR